MTLLGRFLAKSDPLEGRAINANNLPWYQGGEAGGYDESMGVNLSRDSMLGVAATWACVSLISDSVAAMPLQTVAKSGSGKTGAIPAWLEEPNPEDTLTDFKFATLASLLLHGNCFTYLVRDGKQNILEAWNLDPRWVYVRRELKPNRQLALFYYVQVAKGMQSPVGPFKVEAGPDMFHIAAFKPSSSWPAGLAPLDVARKLFGAAIAGQEMAARWFGQGYNAQGVLQTDGELTLDQAKQIKSDFSDAHSGVRRMHLPPVLSGGMKYEPIQISPEQAQFLEQRQFSVDEIARFFRVPPHMIGNLEKTSSWGSGIEQQSIGFVQYTLRPWLDRLERSWTRNFLMFQPSDRFQFDVTDALKGDMAATAEFVMKMHMIGGMNANEIRQKYLGLPPYEDGDQYYFQVNTSPIGQEPITPEKVKVTDIGKGADQPKADSTLTQDGVDVQDTGGRQWLRPPQQVEIPGVEMPSIVVNPTPVTVEAPLVNVRVRPTPVTVHVSPTPVTVLPTPVDVHPTPVTVEAPARRSLQKTVKFADGREAVVLEEEL